MDVLVPLPVAVPVLAAAFLTATGRFLGRRTDDLVGIAVAAATTVLCVLLIFHSADHDLVYWFGGWRPRHGIALGIAFDVEPLGAALAALAGALTTASLVFAWRYFDEVGTLFHVVMLVFLGAMCGFTLTGDLFNLFVLFELMSVCGFALAGYAIEQPGPLQGAVNFAVTNSVGAFLLLIGLALLYGQTGALNLAQIGRALAGERPNGLVIAAFLCLAVGFLVKAGAVPFHFWLSDAYAVAPIPVCVVFSGVMSDLGLHGLARVYWSIFSGPFAADGAALRGIFVALGLLTAFVGGVMCFFQRDLKRLLAFLTISHVGIFLVGIALLSARGLAGTTVYVVADGLVKGTLFLAVGILVRRAKTGDELRLRGLGRIAPLAGIVFVAGGLALAGLPPFGPFLGTSLIVRSALDLGYGWLPPLLTLAAALTAGTVLRAAARIFAGWGDAEDPLLSYEPPEEAEEPEAAGAASPVLLFGPALALVVAGLGLAFTPGLAARAIEHAQVLENRPARAAEVLDGVRAAPRPALGSYHAGRAAVLYGVAGTAGALALAAFGLYRRRLPLLVRRVGGRLDPAVTALKGLHSGAVGDYVMWVTVGAAALGGVFALALR
jgi:multicomponent Na+:H+ antiporter subunit D